MVKATPIGPEEKDSALRRRNGTIPFQVNRFFLMTSKTAAVEYRKPGTDFGPPGDVTDRERRSLYDQRSCHFGSALYQDAPDVKNYFGTQSELFRAGKRILADAVFAPAVIAEFQRSGEVLLPPWPAICILFDTSPGLSAPLTGNLSRPPNRTPRFGAEEKRGNHPGDTIHIIVYIRFILTLRGRFAPDGSRQP